MSVATLPARQHVRTRSPSPLRRHNLQLYVGLAFVTLIVLLAVCAPLLTRFGPNTQSLTATLQPPSAAHLLGTDNLGRDVWSRLLYGARVDLTLASVAVLVPFVVGSLIGALCGYFGGWLDILVMRVADVLAAFPFYVLVISMVFVLGGGVFSIFVAISLISWVPYARIVRGETLIVRSTEFIEASLAGGLGTRRVVLRHVLPNVMTQAIVYSMSDIVLNIGVIVTLSYFGLGIKAPTADWGSMMADGQQFIAGGYITLVLFPGIAVVLTSLGLSLIGDGLAHALRAQQ